MHLNVHRGFIPLILIGLLAGCGNGSGSTGITSSGPAPLSAEVQANPSLTFTPPTVRIQSGGTVRFVFGSVAHNVFFDNAPAGAPANITASSSNTTTTLTFSTVGTFPYNCHIHPGMQGTVVVVTPGQ